MGLLMLMNYLEDELVYRGLLCLPRPFFPFVPHTIGMSFKILSLSWTFPTAFPTCFIVSLPTLA